MWPSNVRFKYIVVLESLIVLSFKHYTHTHTHIHTHTQIKDTKEETSRPKRLLKTIGQSDDYTGLDWIPVAQGKKVTLVVYVFYNITPAMRATLMCTLLKFSARLGKTKWKHYLPRKPKWKVAVMRNPK